MLIDNDQLLVGNKGAENLLSISLIDKKIKVIAKDLSGNIDGLKKIDNTYVCSWKSILFTINQNKKNVLYKSKIKKDFLADFEFIEKYNLIIIPQLMSNKVIALKLDE